MDLPQYGTSVPWKMVEPFDKYLGYGDDAPMGGFIPGRETYSEPYMADVNQTVQDLDGVAPADMNDAIRQRAEELAPRHGLDPNQVYWQLLNQPTLHSRGFKDKPESSDVKEFFGTPYNWALGNENQDPFPDLGEPGRDWAINQRQPAPGGLPIETGEDAAQHYLGNVSRETSRRLAFEHDMNVERQKRRIQMRADEARQHGDDEFGDYVQGLGEVFQGDVDAGRPEPAGHYWPMAVEEFGEHHPEIQRNPGIHPRQAARYALLTDAPHDSQPPDIDWGPVMDSIKDTGGYTIGDAGEAPTSGYMVSLPGTEERRPTDTVTPDTERDYHKRHWDQLRDDPDLSQGGWDSKNTFYTDLSRNDQDLYRTIGDAVTTDQEGIYDLNMDQTLDTMDNPEVSYDDYNPLLVSPGPIASRIAAPRKKKPAKQPAMDIAKVHPALLNYVRHLKQNGGQPSLDDARNWMHSNEEFATPDAKQALWDWFATKGKSVYPKEFSPQGEVGQGTDFRAGPGPYPGPPVGQELKQSLDPHALDDRIDMDTLVKNALSRYHGATPEQLTQGKDWYSQARRQLQAIAQATGGDFSKAAGIMAALSPQLSWETNLNAGTHFLNAYNPNEKHKWRTPNVSADALAKWNEVSGGKPPSTPEEFSALANLAGVDDPDWAKELAVPGAYDRAVASAWNGKGRAPGNFTGTGMPALGDNVLRAMNVYDSDDPRKVLNYASSPKVHSFWRNFLGDESFVTIDKHMLRALDRGFGEDPLMSYGSGKPEVTRETTPEDRRVAELEAMLGRSQGLAGDEQQSVPIGYNSYAEAIRRATAQVNEGKDPSEHVTPAQMQAIIWVQHKGDMDAFAKRKAQEAWDLKNPGKVKPTPKPYTPALPKQPIPEYTQSDEWAEANPYAGGEPRQKRVVGPVGPAMQPDNVVDVDVEPEPVPFVTPPPYKAAGVDGLWHLALLGVSLG